MAIIKILATNPGCGKTYVGTLFYKQFNSKRKYYLIPQNKLVVDVKQQFKCIGVENPKVQTLQHFLGNWRRIDNNGKIEYLKTDKVGPRCPTKRYIDVFIDEASMISAKEISMLVNNCKVRNLILIGDANQFLPISNHNSVSQVGSTQIEEEYVDDGQLVSASNLHIDKTYVLTESMRFEDAELTDTVNRLRDADNIINILDHYRCKPPKLSAIDQHIAYTNHKCAEINEQFLENEIKQFIVKESDKSVDLMKGQLYTSGTSNYREIIAAKRSFFVQEEQFGRLVNAEEALDAWHDQTFGLAHCVTCHKLQGVTIHDKHIYIHIDDIMKFISKAEDDKIEYRKRIDTFHRFLYIAFSRATKDTQVEVVYSDYVIKNKDKLEKYCKSINPFPIPNGQQTTSKTFDYDAAISELDQTEYKNYSLEEAEYAIHHTYEEYRNKYNKSSKSWQRLRSSIHKGTLIRPPIMCINLSSDESSDQDIDQNIIDQSTICPSDSKICVESDSNYIDCRPTVNINCSY